MVLIGIGLTMWRVDKHDALATNTGAIHDGRVQGGRDQVGRIEEGGSQRLKPRSIDRDTGTAEAMPLSKREFSQDANSSREAVPSGGSLEKARAESGSFPAPPLPLTDQERLLLRAAKRGDPPPVAVFEISVLPSRDAEETVEFAEFFWAGLGRFNQVHQERTNDHEERQIRDEGCARCDGDWAGVCDDGRARAGEDRDAEVRAGASADVLSEQRDPGRRRKRNCDGIAEHVRIPMSRMYLVTSENALSVHGTAEDIALVQRLLKDLGPTEEDVSTGIHRDRDG